METRDITLPSGKVATLKLDITGRDKRHLLAPFKRGVELKPTFDGSQPEIIAKNMSIDVMDEALNALIEVLVIKLDGNDQDVLNRTLDLSAGDFDVLSKELNAAQSLFFSTSTT